jgi:hypothetical protein
MTDLLRAALEEVSKRFDERYTDWKWSSDALSIKAFIRIELTAMYEAGYERGKKEEKERIYKRLAAEEGNFLSGNRIFNILEKDFDGNDLPSEHKETV